MSPFKSRNIAVIGAGMAGIACARTLLQAGHQVTVFEKGANAGGRMATRSSPFGSFDHGVQYFTVRDARFARALKTVPGLCKPWSANAVQVLDEHGRIASADVSRKEAHWVPTPDMGALVKRWAAPLQAQGRLELETRISQLERDALQPQQWQLRGIGPGGTQHVYSGFDAVLLAIPAEPARLLLNTAQKADGLAQKIDRVQMAPCWTLMLAFPQAVQPGLTTLGPQWNAARSTHRLAGARIEQARTRRRRALDRAGQRRLVAGTSGRRSAARAGQADQGLLRGDGHPCRTGPCRQPALALRPDQRGAGQIASVGRQDRRRGLR